jgi:general secretion pathway protein K
VADRSKPNDGQRGIALIAVLGFLTVMSLLTISVVGASRTSINGATRHLARVQAEAAVESGVNLAVVQLIAARILAPPVLSAPQQFAIGGYDVVVAARPESSKIDLNFADLPLLMGMFRAAGADPDQASALASAVLDWRDADDLLHVNGAEAREYEAAGLRYSPSNRLFESVAELRLVLGVTNAIFNCLRPDLTVHAQRADVDLASASPLVRRAAGVNPDEPKSPPPAQSVISGQAVGAGEIFEITARIDDLSRRVRRAERVVVRITGNQREPYWTLSAEPAFPAIDAAARACPKQTASN